jgi:hypothetical protein
VGNHWKEFFVMETDEFQKTVKGYLDYFEQAATLPSTWGDLSQEEAMKMLCEDFRGKIELLVNEFLADRAAS